MMQKEIQKATPIHSKIARWLYVILLALLGLPSFKIRSSLSITSAITARTTIYFHRNIFFATIVSFSSQSRSSFFSAVIHLSSTNLINQLIEAKHAKSIHNYLKLLLKGTTTTKCISRSFFAPEEGLEPPTWWLTATRSTN